MKITLISLKPQGFHVNQYFPNLWIKRPSTSYKQEKKEELCSQSDWEGSEAPPTHTPFLLLRVTNPCKAGFFFLTSQILFPFLKGRPGRTKPRLLLSTMLFVPGAFVLQIALVSKLEHTRRVELEAACLCCHPPVTLVSVNRSTVKIKDKLQGRGNDSSGRNILARVVRSTRTHVIKKPCI